MSAYDHLAVSGGEPAPALAVRELTFAYSVELAGAEARAVLRDATLEVPKGAFALVTGGTGSGKTTLLRLVKPEVSPVGERSGSIEVFGRDVRELDVRTSVQDIGFVFQSPENQIVCDEVWHELAFGLENLGVAPREMRLRVAETCQFLGMEPLYRARCAELSGGQRQLVALASVLVMRPRLLLLDEPTSQLDPVSEKAFLALLFRVNRELGVTVIVATHRPGPMVDYATCAYALEGGAVHEMALEDVRARGLEAVGTDADEDPAARASRSAMKALTLDDVWFRYRRDDSWVLRGCDLHVERGEVRALMGANGCGKSTLLGLASGASKPRRGRVARPLAHAQALLPQTPQVLLGCETVYDELAEWKRAAGYGTDEVEQALERLGLSSMRDRHPFDLSLGQQQLLAFEKLVLSQPQLLLLDEPTKGLDERACAYVATRVRELARAGTTCIIATHDAAFVRAACQTVSLLFDGQTVLTDTVEGFLAGTWVYRELS